MKLHDQLEKEVFDIIKERTNLVNIEELFMLDQWFTSKEALSHKILTKIL